MLWNISDPFHAAGLELDLGIKPPGHGLIDNVLLLLFEKFNELPLVADEFVDLSTFPVQKPADQTLFFLRWEG